MKQVIEMLVQAYGIIRENLIGDEDDINMVHSLIAGAISDLKAPRWETPEQREKRTGEKWPDDWAVYMRMQQADGTWSAWRAMACNEAQCNLHTTQIVCATSAPPPENWSPEGEKC